MPINFCFIIASTKERWLACCWLWTKARVSIGSFLFVSPSSSFLFLFFQTEHWLRTKLRRLSSHAVCQHVSVCPNPVTTPTAAGCDWRVHILSLNVPRQALELSHSQVTVILFNLVYMRSVVCLSRLRFCFYPPFIFFSHIYN